MRYLTLLSLFALSLFSCDNKTGSEHFLKGKLSNSHGEKIVLEKLLPEKKEAIDSTTVNEKGEFSFSTDSLEMGFYNVKISDRNFAMLILDKDQDVIFSADAANLGSSYTVEGSADSKLFWEMNKFSERNYRKRDSLTKVYNIYLNSGKADPKKLDSIQQSLQRPFDNIVAEQNDYLTSFIDKNSGSLASLAAIEQLSPDEYFEYFEKLDKGLNSKYPGSTYVQLYHKRFEKLQQEQKALAIGSPAPEIVLPDPQGNPVALSSLKGKVVLVDFWASWCGPCRKENPNIVKAYKEFKPKGLEIYAVSLDREKESWIKAIENDKLTWIHVSDLMEWRSPVVGSYGFGNKGIPFNCLIDKEGKVIAKGLRGKALEDKLKEILG
jgi:thiol-disulfide isomerase/thioredoxin